MIFPRSFARKIAPPLKYAPQLSSPELSVGTQVVDARDRAAEAFRGRPDEPLRGGRVELAVGDRVDPAEAAAGLREALELAAGAQLHAHERAAPREQGRVDPLRRDAKALDAADLARREVARARARRRRGAAASAAASPVGAVRLR